MPFPILFFVFSYFKRERDTPTDTHRQTDKDVRRGEGGGRGGAVGVLLKLSNELATHFGM